MLSAGSPSPATNQQYPSVPNVTRDSVAGYWHLRRDSWLDYMRIHWRLGEHVLILGPTGSGKTYLAREILPFRRASIAVCVKRHDDTAKDFLDEGYTWVESWPFPRNALRILFWDRPTGLERDTAQHDNIRDVLHKIFVAGKWCVFFDDANYMVAKMGMRHEIGEYAFLGRSAQITSVFAGTRPTGLRDVIGQVRHVITFAYNDRDELDSAASISGIDKTYFRLLSKKLGEHDFIYTHKGYPVIVRA